MGNNNYGKLGLPLENASKNYPIQIPFVIGFFIYYLNIYLWLNLKMFIIYFPFIYKVKKQRKYAVELIIQYYLQVFYF